MISERSKYYYYLYLNTNFHYSNRDFNKSNLLKPSDIIILKRVNSLRQLRNTEKELVRLCYKEAILKGFLLMKDVQCYIASKSKIWIERGGIEYLKRSEEEENKKWYYHLAKDHFAYVGVYRKAVDEIEQYKKELWKMMIDSKTTNLEKVQISKELHNLTKTSTLLLIDLPFVSNLTRYYDKNDPAKLCDKRDDNINNYSKQRYGYDDEDLDLDNKVDNDQKYFQSRELSTKKRREESGLYLGNPELDSDQLQSTERKYSLPNTDVLLLKSILNSIRNNKDTKSNGHQIPILDDESNIIIDKNTSEPMSFVVNKSDLVKDEKITEVVMRDMRSQLTGLGFSPEIMKQNEKNMDKLNEIIETNKLIDELEYEIEKIGGIENIQGNYQLKEILKKYEESLNFLDKFISAEQRESIKRIMDITEE